MASVPFDVENGERPSGMSHDVQLSMLGCGSVIGYEAAVTKGMHKQNVRAVTPCVAYEITAVHLQNIFRANRGAAGHMETCFEQATHTHIHTLILYHLPFNSNFLYFRTGDCVVNVPYTDTL